jgi:uncharacterized glyoxalase superfamily protein PhnB
MSAWGVQAYMGIGPKSGGAKKAIAWYKSALGAEVKSALACSTPDSDEERILHAEIVLGSTTIMISDAFRGMCSSPEEIGGSPVSFFANIPGKSKEVFDKAISEGAKVREHGEYKEQPWGWNAGSIIDPFGYSWMIGEDVKKWSDKDIAEHMGNKDIASSF